LFIFGRHFSRFSFYNMTANFTPHLAVFTILLARARMHARVTYTRVDAYLW